MLESVGIDAALGDLVSAELVDQAAFHPQPEYAFRHPLVRAVAYESQLKSDRAQLHKRLAAAIEQDDQNAALIAEHLEAAGDLAAAYEWHMRAGGWSSSRDIAAAQLSWERALEVADALPADAENRMAKRIAPRTLICGNSWKRFHPDISSRFSELQDLCTQVGDKASLAVGMAGMTVEYVLHGRVRDASRLASEYMALVESIDDPALTIALSFAGVVAKHETGESTEALRWTQAVIDLAVEDPDQGQAHIRVSTRDGPGMAGCGPISHRRTRLAGRLRPGNGYRGAVRHVVAVDDHHLQIRGYTARTLCDGR